MYSIRWLSAVLASALILGVAGCGGAQTHDTARGASVREAVPAGEVTPTLSERANVWLT